MHDPTSARPNGGNKLLYKRASDDRDLSLRVPLERVEREGDTNARAFLECDAVRRWHMKLDQSVPDLLQLRFRGRDVLLEQRSDARVGEGLALIGLLRSRRSRGVPRL